jgi:hypothetical protein
MAFVGAIEWNAETRTNRSNKVVVVVRSCFLSNSSSSSSYLHLFVLLSLHLCVSAVVVVVGSTFD